MTEQQPVATVQSIRLTAFQCDPDYQPKHLIAIHYNVAVGHRVPPTGETLEIQVRITYQEKDRPDMLVDSTCLTTYLLENVQRGPDSTDGQPTVTVPEAALRRMTTEAIAHARAVLATQTAGTPFSRTHIAIQDVAPVETGDAAAS
jgi:hypothetical protein